MLTERNSVWKKIPYIMSFGKGEIDACSGSDPRSILKFEVFLRHARKAKRLATPY